MAPHPAPPAPADPAILLTWLAQGPVTVSSLPFVAAPHLADPLEPLVDGATAWARYANSKYRWLADRGAQVAPIALTRTSQRMVSEVALLLKHEGKPLALPVALVADLVRSGKDVGKWTAVRIYHGLWPLLGTHRVRGPLIPADPALKMGDAIGAYHAALRAGNLNAMLGLFDPDGYAREPSGGGSYLDGGGFFRGTEGIRAFYSDLFASGAGIRLEYCTYTDDGVRGALEYQATQWGRTPIPPQAGVAVYERGKPGKLKAARIYDDIAPEG